ncbi:MAG: hypothetical protein M3Y21_02160 [Candidatus Eremiobacteraeota bacterium]|nr:hypothetical protein [Candidatus Eremiobacteraeota bacterium]
MSEAPSGGIPATGTAFIGRRAAILEVIGRLDEYRLVTIRVSKLYAELENHERALGEQLREVRYLCSAGRAGEGRQLFASLSEELLAIEHPEVMGHALDALVALHLSGNSASTPQMFQLARSYRIAHKLVVYPIARSIDDRDAARIGAVVEETGASPSDLRQRALATITAELERQPRCESF